ncbi:MAG: alpha/beta hydrolase [Hyphomicrobiales bacterium]|nr:alpha/beta hydrolase [Hyphomicrobiales bacterium]
MGRPPVLFIHGAFSNGGHFAPWVDRFSRAGFDCHAPSLPGHGPSDDRALATVTIADYLAALEREVAKLSELPILVGHSMGGLLAQQLAARRRCRALVCVASAPPWMLPAQPRALPYFLPMLPAILAGRPVHPPEATLRALVLHHLPEDEQRALLPTFGAESGQAYRAMIFGTAPLPGPPFRGPVLCLSGRDDRVIPNRTSAAIAKLHGARHEIFTQGHWLIAASLAEQVAGAALRWLDDSLDRAQAA